MLWDSWRRIDPANHRFAGFEDSPVPAWLLDSRLRVGTAPLGIDLHRDAVVVPPSLTAPDPWRSGGLMTAAGDLIPHVRDWTPEEQTLLGMGEPVPAAPVESIQGDVLYLGWLFDSFGHFLIESLARIWALDLVPPTTRVLFQYWPGMTPKPHLLKVLAEFGLAPDRIIFPGHPLRVRSLLVPDPDFLVTSMVHERAGDPFRRVASRIAGGAAPSDQPVYFSRILLPSHHRAIVGEAEFEDLLRDNGFLVVHPQTMPFAEQVRIAATHRVLVAGKGSASELMRFAAPGARCHLLTMEPLLDVHLLCAEPAKTQNTYHNVLRFRHDPLASVALDIEAAAAGLAADGLLPRQARLPFLPRDVAASLEFEEAWLFDCLTSGRIVDPAQRQDVDDAIARVRPSAWPVLAALAAITPGSEMTDEQADQLMLAFAFALADESDAARRIRHASAVRALAEQALPRCLPETQALVRSVLADRLPAAA